MFNLKISKCCFSNVKFNNRISKNKLTALAVNTWSRLMIQWILIFSLHHQYLSQYLHLLLHHKEPVDWELNPHLHHSSHRLKKQGQVFNLDTNKLKSSCPWFGIDSLLNSVLTFIAYEFVPIGLGLIVYSLVSVLTKRY